MFGSVSSPTVATALVFVAIYLKKKKKKKPVRIFSNLYKTISFSKSDPNNLFKPVKMTGVNLFNPLQESPF